MNGRCTSRVLYVFPGTRTPPSDTKTHASMGDASVSGTGSMTEVAALVAQEPGDVKFCNVLSELLGRKTNF